ncbi:hypothetical protein SCHPADRAFT_901233 [Schizopora paradoxa]|uniref:Uncharacterized protein n=1 Tax=Schizopora paradoxa TaxID=27342 RepID=A0A0H2RYQ5_9AGAM|nr:hypothetical protein SCHPADRAFT_901233 [Schizopora paradoxa]
MTRIHSPGEGTYIQRDGDGHNNFTKTIQQAKESLMQGDAFKEIKQTTKMFQTSHGTPMVQPSGVFTSLETTASGKRYADRPEGIDQFGGEEFERDVYGGDAPNSVTASLRQVTQQPGTLDQFGGEGIEREVFEIQEWEKKPSHAISVQKWPQGADELGGLKERNNSA